MRFVDLFAGIGGFHVALAKLGHECVFACEIDDELRRKYEENFPGMSGKIHGDIRECKLDVPEHEILCAGFPCQPFSKSGYQHGEKDQTRGTLFYEILEILERIHPRYVLLENVGNFGRHDSGRTWYVVQEQLKKLGYDVAGTEHKTPRSKGDWRDKGFNNDNISEASNYGINSCGSGLISPHHFGYPQHRERFYIVASLDGLPEQVFPVGRQDASTSLKKIIQLKAELDDDDLRETTLTAKKTSCIEHWNSLLQSLPKETIIPSFPIWGDEVFANYPYKIETPWSELRGDPDRQIKLAQLPSYAREETETFRNWKIRYIEQNRMWWKDIQREIPNEWVTKLKGFPASLRKLEWNAKGETLDLWQCILQFRPSGLRAKRYNCSPALIAMTQTQIPILGPEKRFLTRVEGKRLQGFDDAHILPKSRQKAFKALGNAVHVKVVEKIAQHLKLY